MSPYNPYSMSVILIAGDIPYYETHGFGTQTEGGLSGKVNKVINLNKDGPGSFRAACTPIMFAVIPE
jgi:hypothetical protein